VHLTSLNLSTLDGEAQQDGGEPKLAPWGSKTGYKAYAVPSPPLFRIKAGLLPSFFLFLLPYLSTVLPLLLPIVWQYALLLASYSSTIPA